MSESVTALRSRISSLRDAALTLFGMAQDSYNLGTQEKQWNPWSPPQAIWNILPEDTQKLADGLRSEFRSTMVRITSALRDSPLIGEADLRDLRRHAKVIDAALRFCEFHQWNIEVLHDEGTVLGVSPPGQSESNLDSVQKAQELFTESYRAVTEMMDYWSPLYPGISPVLSESRSPGIRSYRQNTAFLMMWINPELPELSDVRDTVEEVFKEFGIKATRADEIEHEGMITERIIQEIATSEFLLADLSGERPSVYYEVGYAHAIGKRVILFKKKGTKLHFDLAAYNCPEYENLGDLRMKLRKRLAALMNKPDAGSLPDTPPKAFQE